MSVQPLKASDTLAYPGDPTIPTDPVILKACPPLPSCPQPPGARAATVEARPTPSGKPRHAHSPNRLPVNFRKGACVISLEFRTCRRVKNVNVQTSRSTSH